MSVSPYYAGELTAEDASQEKAGFDVDAEKQGVFPELMSSPQISDFDFPLCSFGR